MRKKFKLASLLFSAATVLVACGSNEADTNTTGSEDNTFIVGLEAAYAPFNWT